jgi:hypothetical protein
MKIKNFALTTVLAAATFIFGAAAEAGNYALVASDGYLIGNPNGGDRFSYDGKLVQPSPGGVAIYLDSDNNIGAVVATFRTEKGVYTIVHQKFDKIATNIYLHGDSGTGPPVLPKVWTYLATWGKADVWFNGKFVADDWPTHLMWTEGARDDFTHKVDFKGPMGLKKEGYKGSTDPADMEIHLVVHSPKEKPGSGFPPFEVFYHLLWEKVTVK